MNELYIGTSGAGKTYEMRHKLLDHIRPGSSAIVDHIYIIGRKGEYNIFKKKICTFIDVEELNNKKIVKQIESWESIFNSLFIFDDIQSIAATNEEVLKLIDRLCRFSRTHQNKILMSLIDPDLMISNSDIKGIVLNSNRIYVGKMASYELEVMKKIYSQDVMTLLEKFSYDYNNISSKNRVPFIDILEMGRAIHNNNEHAELLSQLASRL